MKGQVRIDHEWIAIENEIQNRAREAATMREDDAEMRCTSLRCLVAALRRVAFYYFTCCCFVLRCAAYYRRAALRIIARLRYDALHCASSLRY
jgi:hypothetical protein